MYFYIHSYSYFSYFFMYYTILYIYIVLYILYILLVSKIVINKSQYNFLFLLIMFY